MTIGNTTTRIIISVIFIPLILGAVYFGGLFFLLFVLGIGSISFYEFAKLTGKKGSFPNIIIGLVSVILVILNAYYSFIDFYRLFLFIIPALTITELFRNKDSVILNTGSTLFGIFYIGLFSSTLIGIREFYNYSGLLYDQGGYLIISVFISLWMCDSAAFFLGSAFGKHKLFPRVSPNKSWEGAFAGFIFAVLTMLAAKFVLLDFLNWIDIIVIGIIIGSIGQVGDLIESLIKRDAGVKDSSSLIPGHGGLFDRFDSLLLLSPVIYLYITLI